VSIISGIVPSNAAPEPSTSSGELSKPVARPSPNPSASSVNREQEVSGLQLDLVEAIACTFGIQPSFFFVSSPLALAAASA